MPTRAELSAMLQAKELEIKHFIAARLGYGQVDALDSWNNHRLDQEVDSLIEEFEESLVHGIRPLAWRAIEAQLENTKLGSLMLERHELERQLTDEADGLR